MPSLIGALSCSARPFGPRDLTVYAHLVKSWLTCSVVLIALLPGCALLTTAPDQVVPESPSAREVMTLSPGQRDRLLPPPAFFDGTSYVGRLICPGGDQVDWKRTGHEGPRETYDVHCPDGRALSIHVDISQPEPPAPSGFRLLNARSYPSFRDALAAGEKKDFITMLSDLDTALAITPGEPLYRRERIYALYSLGRPLEALLEADDLLKTSPTVMVFRYRALAGRQLNMRDVVMSSIDAIIAITRPGNPQYSEAICAKGVLLDGEGDARGVRLIDKGCALKFDPCCIALKERQDRAPH